jgi:cobyrinic acid a,c-diamide synthase
VCRTRGSGTAASAASASSPPVIAWARDAAFTFHYADNVELLETLGARVVSWSPLVDHRLPRGTAAIVLGGGYPELFAKTLAENAAALDAVRQFVTRGGPVYAECGGLMYLARGIAAGGRRHRLAGVVPAWAEMTSRPRLAYVNAEPLRDTILTTRGTMLRGHEFHTSRLTPTPSAGVAAYRVVDAADRGGPARPRPDGYARGGVLASYVHVNFLGEPRLAERLLCRATAPRFRR